MSATQGALAAFASINSINSSNNSSNNNSNTNSSPYKSSRDSRKSLDSTQSAQVALWSTASRPRKASISSDSPPSIAQNSSNRVMSDVPVPVFTVDGSKRTIMLTSRMTREDVIKEFLGRLNLYQYAGDCVLLSVVKDETTVVQNALPLALKNKWPLIVSSNKTDLPKCRFVIRYVGNKPALAKILGPPLDIKNLRTV